MRILVKYNILFKLTKSLERRGLLLVLINLDYLEVLCGQYRCNV